MTARRGLALAGVALAAALVTGRVLAGVYAEWAWYNALGAGATWSARLEALTALRLGLFAVGFVFAFANLLVLRRSIVSLVLPRQLGNLVIGEAVPGSTLTGVTVLLSTVIAAGMALANDAWLVFLRALWSSPLGEGDPYLGRDMAFWMGWLPFERNLHAWCVMLAVVVGATVLALYALTPSLRVDHGQLHLSTRARRHFAVFTAILLLLVAWGYRLDAFDLLIHGSGVRETFVAFDHLVMYPFLIAAGIGTAAAALLVAWTGWMGQQRATLAALLLVAVAGPVGRTLLPVLDRQAVTARERSALDRTYVNVRALYTRRAYRLDDVQRGAAADSVRVDASRLSASASGWEPAALAHALAEDAGAAVVEGTTNWRRAGDGRLRAGVLLGTASSDVSRAPLVRREVDPTDADDRGAPSPPPDVVGATVPALAVGKGLTAALPAVDTLGQVGAPVFPGGWRRAALAWGVRDLRLAALAVGDRRTKLLMRRDVRERVQELVPFFAAGLTTQAAIVGDSLWWVLELFNASDDYPLTEPMLLGGVPQRYATSAGVALVNAHSGRVRVLLPRDADRVARWWRDRLPALFVLPHSVPAELLAALPAPIDRAFVQGNALSRVGFRNDTMTARPLYHVDDADVDLLSGPPAPFVSGAAGAPLAWAVPVVDAVDRVRGAFVARGGAVPATALVEAPDTLTWSSIINRLQRAADSAQVSASRRHPRHGRVQVVPATDGLHVMQAFYEWPPDRAPVLAGVVALHEGQVRVGGSVAVALGAPVRTSPSNGSLRPQIARLYAAMQDALRRGDWPAFGRAMEGLRGLASGR